MLELKNISFAYKAQSPVINNVSLTIATGEFLAIAGRNGSGKTTLTRLIMALKKPTSGEITLDGKTTKKSGPADMARSIGYVFQNPDRQIFHDTVIAEVAYGPEQLGYSPDKVTEMVNQALTATGLTELASAYPATLSRGQKQRLAIASALAMEPKMLILDEPTSGQDNIERNQLMKLLADLNKQGLAILLITHDMELLAAYATRVIVMDHGTNAYDGTPATLFKNTAQLKKWGLTEPTAMNISQNLEDLGIVPTTSITDLSNHLIDMMGRSTHAKSSAAY
ncbi:Energy-coupling factor transporter ATP-binding protein EcfA2 [bioreactor metagenome]|uniref:Energy-coupling factor transporter ATP-binding protein EcfA2 n=1 Tax=bioreactor metagenome TaxID=1076179 RepID=A0A644U8F7_9ZZZZ|nr:ABC transporter ATP-binding protein [Negativicutes bacterium]